MRQIRGFGSPLVAGCALALAAAGCSGLDFERGMSPVPEGKTITAEQIRRSGAQNGWEVLRRTGTHLSLREDARGQPTRMNYRGHNSIELSSTPLVYVDGAKVAEFSYLRDVPAKIIQRIRIYSGVSGTKYFGTGGGNGVIMVETNAALADQS